MQIGDLCNRNVVTVERHDGLRKAAALMREHHVGDVVIVDRSGGYLAPLGIVTDRDIVVEVVAKGIDLEDVSVGDVAARELVTAREDDELIATLERMRAHGVRRLPVVDAKGRLAGIVTVDDLIGIPAKELAEIWALILRERRQESDVRGAAA